MLLASWIGLDYLLCGSVTVASNERPWKLHYEELINQHILYLMTQLPSLLLDCADSDASASSAKYFTRTMAD